MDESTRNEIVRQRQAGSSIRQIARALGTTRRTVKRVLDQVQAARSGQPAAAPKPAIRRPSQLDAYGDVIDELLRRYPTITAVRVWEELRAGGYSGCYSVVRDQVRRVRPQPSKEPVVRFETLPGAQAQADYSTYDIDFSDEGRRRVYLFSYLLSWSRRQYLRFVESQDFASTLREHIRAFEHLGGVAATCLYDNLKVVVLRHDADGPIYNPRFLAFATHYGFKPWACRVRRSQTKGKVERPFYYVETSLLNGRTFRTLEHLNAVTAWWLAKVADIRVHRETRARPIDRHALELPKLIPLPAQHYEVAPVVYRVVGVEGFIAYQHHFYSAPWRFIGQTLPVRITEAEVIVYNPNLEEVARHRLFPRNLTGQQSEDPTHRPREDARQDEALLRERFAELGPTARRFLDGLLRDQRCGKAQARKVLALLGTYAHADLLAALERAVRFGAYSAAAIERILAAQARPKSVLDVLAEEERRRLPALGHEPVPPRPLSDYQPLIEETTDAPPTESSEPEPPRSEPPPGPEGDRPA
jgi:transposase